MSIITWVHGLYTYYQGTYSNVVPCYYTKELQNLATAKDFPVWKVLCHLLYVLHIVMY